MADHNINLVDSTDDPPSTSHSPPPQAQSQSPKTTPAAATEPETAHIDILYENQRGWFVFGLPLFSSKALWNLRIDQSPWVDARFKPSAVNITNAQVPDPSWVWDWKSWYVDMSQDVDEEGWQYSLWFRGAAWHGNHPWFHSFVRRRRWLRKRVKRKAGGRDERDRLFGEAFSIGTTLGRTLTMNSPLSGNGEDKEYEEDEVANVPTLMRRLKNAAIDREKIVFINRFIAEGGEELHYLAEQIPAIMSMLVFQNSRRQLLSTLTATIESARAHRAEHKESGEPEDDAEERRINNLLKAIEAADAECKQLEYWSDIRRLTENGRAGNAVDSGSWGKGWEGLDGSGPSHPEH
ncbi:hypothetical protein P280DRAFT_413180 [Massarina eburnea CBS 473.64]|uniref:Peroxin/Ferlin domain-containing protein n=1 Tax=Massarina eburnea CBS 473.64 TaxID=1395130 RepID=A0A6A6RHQ4_9PLEO|nr:hypothetical protein P280DRAFT_413180 [Massarina eburnea CBS 473.64]